MGRNLGKNGREGFKGSRPMPSPIFIFRHPQRILSSFPFFFPFPFQKEWKRGRKRCVASRNNGPSISTDFSRHGTRVFSPLLPPLLHPQTLEILSSKEYIMEHIYRINPLSSKFSTHCNKVSLPNELLSRLKFFNEARMRFY